ncbi:uncharacterized protein LOC124158283 isoform X2 [Ischnura elegans]|uniref:uncharacterized protein LOC124158283 isoform X2 n=1 Tax=Ischnura elegans TaxID=197161 RepID=UPI001ED8BE25|nr:uncharacterized protein LOC124158283 isoform X2 [Ischnura elegans]
MVVMDFILEFAATFYWLLVIFMFLLCSGGGWWYRSWLQARLQGGLGTPLPGMAPPMNPASAAVSALGAPSSQCCTGVLVRTSRTQPRFARITYHPSDTVALQHIWKGPGTRMAHDQPPPPYSSLEGESTSSAHPMPCRDLNDGIALPSGSHPLPPCPYLLYGPPPSYDSIVTEMNQLAAFPQEEGAVGVELPPQTVAHDNGGPSTSNAHQCPPQQPSFLKPQDEERSGPSSFSTRGDDHVPKPEPSGSR